uniref:Uncharacterized protein n=1 Tax=Gossypium raimondii TaxID=29730 RepID=A0A0D2M260_GOSRA|nr:hypothetical protein B456_001G234800 [Gossypium raimondii]
MLCLGLQHQGCHGLKNLIKVQRQKERKSHCSFCIALPSALPQFREPWKGVVRYDEEWSLFNLLNCTCY